MNNDESEGRVMVDGMDLSERIEQVLRDNRVTVRSRMPIGRAQVQRLHRAVAQEIIEAISDHQRGGV